MAERAIREFDGKRLLSRLLVDHASSAEDAALLRRSFHGSRVLQVAGACPDWDALAASAPWVHTTKLVVKPDQLIKRRGKGGLLLLNADWEGVKAWVSERNGKEVSVDGVAGELNTFLVEPFVPHGGDCEYYICIASQRAGEDILFTTQGGVDVGDVDAKARRLTVLIGDTPSAEAVEASLLGDVPPSRRPALIAFIRALFSMYMACHYVYLEINPLVVMETAAPAPAGASAAGGDVAIVPLDMAAKLDEAANFLAATNWGADLTFPPPFGRSPHPEEAYIREMDGKTGASLKLTILNRRGRVWTMVAGGGASVVYAGECLLWCSGLDAFASSSPCLCTTAALTPSASPYALPLPPRPPLPPVSPSLFHAPPAHLPPLQTPSATLASGTSWPTTASTAAPRARSRRTSTPRPSSSS